MKKSRLQPKKSHDCPWCWNRTLCTHGRGPSRKARIGPGSPQKRQERFRRQYGSSEYVALLRTQPCAVCDAPPKYTVAAHTATGGMGMKAGPETLVPLCSSRPGTKGCHEKLDDYELEDERPRLQQLARERWDRWRKDHEPQDTGDRR